MNITVPKSWPELSPSQAQWLLRQMVSFQGSMQELRAIAFLRFSKIRVIGRSRPGQYLMQRGNKIFAVTPSIFADCIRSLDWISPTLPHPWRPQRIAGRPPRPASLLDLPFGDFLSLDNLYAGAIATARRNQGRPDRDIIRQMADILIGKFRRPIRPFEAQALLMWFAAVKQRLISDYHDFYSSSPDDDSLSPDDNGAISPRKLIEAMNAQIRALTKGDITKEKEILDMPLMRAMVELNALAREYRELKEKSRQ